MISKASNALIESFTQTKHQMELENDRRKLADFHQIIKKRRIKVKGQVKQPETFNQTIQLAEKFKSIDDHKIPLQDFQKRYFTNAQTGLIQERVDQLLKRDGPNKLTQKATVHWSLKLLREFMTPFSFLLITGSILCFVAYALSPIDTSNLFLGVVLFVIVVLTNLISFYQNIKSQAIMDSFKNFIPSQTLVIRNGVENKIDATNLVVGDVVKIQRGKKIPADIRIIDSIDMKVDNSSLTGQTQLLDKSPECSDDNPLETKNIIFFSTLNRQGTGKGIVFATGDRTFIGQIANLTTSAKTEEFPLKKQIKRFIVRLTIFAVVLGSILFGLGFAIGNPAVINFIFAIGIIISSVPVGLIVEVTVCLTISATRLADKKVLCKSLNAVQTLGSTSCICSDKTGTLTMNKMTAANLWYSGSMKKADNREKKGPKFAYEYDINEPGFKSLHQTAVVCSVARFDQNIPAENLSMISSNKSLTKKEIQQKIKCQKGKWKEELKTKHYSDMPTIGDASETGLIKFFQPIADITRTRQKYPVIRDFEGKQCRLSFNSINKYAFTINYYKTQDSYFCIFTKGAPQKIWKLCSHVDVGGKPILKTEEWDKMFKQVNIKFGKNGERVLGFAKYHLPKDKYPEDYQFNLEKENFDFKQQCFVGILSLNDPPRDPVPYAVLKCRSAGIKVIMITGDQPITAVSIAKQCNIVNEETVNQIAERTGKGFQQCFDQSNAIVIHGDQLTKMSLEDEGLPQHQQGKKLSKWLSKSQIVFARTTPAQKLIIVKGCQKLGHVVAVTGDGVNDSPAIKKADIGISMGITGTDVAKDAADMILLSDDFSAIISGIEEGRRIFDNLKKTVCYSLTSQFAQLLPFVAFVIFQFPPPVTTVIVLYISIGTDLIPDISFAYQPGQIDLMTRRPRLKRQHLVTLKLMSQCYGYIGWTQFWGSLFSYFVVANDFGFTPSSLLFSTNTDLILPAPDDAYSETAWNFGNSHLSSTSCDNHKEMIDWIYTNQARVDLRMAAVKCTLDANGLPIYSPIFNFGSCNVYQISPFSNRPVCFTTQGIKYAQSAYFFSVVICQMVNIFACKTRKLSLFTQGLGNTFMLFALTTQFMLLLAAAYFQPFNTAFGTRDNIYMHFGTPALPFAFLQLIIDEIRKYLIRNLKPNKFGKPHWFVRAAQW